MVLKLAFVQFSEQKISRIILQLFFTNKKSLKLDKFRPGNNNQGVGITNVTVYFC
jgi:hypothetical protein